MVGDNLQVLDIEKLSMVVLRGVPRDAAIARPSYDGVGLARRAPNQDPAVAPLNCGSDALIECGSWQVSKGGVLGLVVGQSSFDGESEVELRDRRGSADDIIVGARKPRQAKLAAEGAESERFVRNGVLFDG